MTLITGASGYLGRRLVESLRTRSEDELVLWGRSLDGFEGDRATLASGDMTDDQPFREVDPNGITRIIHAAAVTRFNVDPDTAREVNVEGARKLFDFARRCPNLESFDLLSTVYAFGLEGGRLTERPAAGDSGFANEYERSKNQAENLLIHEYDDLPWRIERIATVIADDQGGAVAQENAVHNTLKLLYYGLLSLVPGKPEVPLYFVTADFVTDVLVSVMEAGDLRQIYHVCHRKDESLTLDEFLDIVFETFEEDEKFRSRRALRPLYTDADSFDLMVEQVSGFSGGILGQAVGSVAPFARELFSVKEFSNENARRVAGDGVPHDERELVANVCRSLVRSRFGVANVAV